VAVRHPRVSVVIPAYNRASMIREAIESVLAQTYSDLEVIVVDDGSTDGTADIVRGFGPKVRYIPTEHVGVGRARNAGIEAARGELLCYCDSDDIQFPYRIATQVQLLDRFRDAALVSADAKGYTDGKVVSESHLRQTWLGPGVRSLEAELREGFPAARSCEELGIRVPPTLKASKVYAGPALKLLIRMNLAWGCTLMARLDAVRAVGGHLVGPEAYEDWYLACQLAKSHPLVHWDAPVLLYRLHPGQQVGKPLPNTRSYVTVIEQVWRADPQVYAANRRAIDRVTASGFVMRGEAEAAADQWDAAARDFRLAIRWNPWIKRAYVNWLVAMVERRLSGRGRLLDRALQRCLSPEARRRANSVP
jgi:glycosyltransferase involved in cell wall biosynthesis